MNLDNFKIQIRKITDFSEDECSMFIPYLNKKLLTKGDYLLKEGQFVNEIAFIEKGTLRLYYLSNDMFEYAIGQETIQISNDSFSIHFHYIRVV